MNTYGEWRPCSILSYISALDEGELSASHPCRVTSGERATDKH
jgi:hypothetical protein